MSHEGDKESLVFDCKVYGLNIEKRMYIQHINELPPVETRAIIINHNTKLVTTLALMSALRHIDVPILVIDCESTDGSWEHFSSLMKQYNFELLKAPLQNHGLTLDWLFTYLPAEQILLIDSDLEIRDGWVFQWMRSAIADPHIFGSGIVHQGGWMTQHKMWFGYYVERCWIPFTFLKVEPIRQALQQGQSFLPKTVLNEFPPSQLIARLLIKRFRIPLLRNLRLALLDFVRQPYFGHKPAIVAYDTGAQIYQYLCQGSQYAFASLPWNVSEQYLTHFHGVTRLQLNDRDRNGTALSQIESEVALRLREEYGITVPGTV